MSTTEHPAPNLREVTDWAEQRGMENLREHMAAMDDLKKDSNTALTIFMAAGGAAIAYAINHATEAPLRALVLGAASMGVYLLVLSGLLMDKCLLTRDAPTVANEPLKLFQPSFTLQQLKAAELKNISERIETAKDRNKSTAKWLNALRYASLASPIVFTIIFALFRSCHSS